MQFRRGVRRCICRDTAANSSSSVSLSFSFCLCLRLFLSFSLSLPPSHPNCGTKALLGSVNESSLHSSYDLFFAHGQRTQAGTISPLFHLYVPPHIHTCTEQFTHTHTHHTCIHEEQGSVLPSLSPSRSRSSTPLPPPFISQTIGDKSYSVLVGPIGCCQAVPSYSPGSGSE